ncbi:spondin-2-like [Daphnia carinata]|uniref:spondin-2-like n=1 Tax=Daphnia carinata TaxID=120202 RepID=UPI00257AF45C|nr:spondin-2-like [Daphnia carinata]
MWYVVRTTSHVLTFLVILLIVSFAMAKPRSGKRSPSFSSKERSPFLCDPDKLMVYKVTLATHWSRTLFPKQYPEWRPPAQWSKVIGRSHDSSYTLFRISQSSSEGFKEFTETGRSDTLDAQSQGEGGIFDEFNAPPVTAGEGKTEAEFFVDSNHSRVSLASRIVPSPDWFVGLDSFNLCIDGQWVDSVAIKVGPMDGGTDNGFTFTSPNWPSDPTEKIFRITSHMPNHPANSFYYPDLNDLPPIATFFFVKVKEYALAEIFDAVTMAPTSETQTPILEDTLLQGAETPSSTTSSSVPSEKYIEQSDRDEIEDIEEQNNETLRKKSKKSGVKSKGESTKKSSLLKSLVTEYSRDERAKKNRRGRKWTNLSGPRHCMVSEWGPWSACSKSCGIGESTRTRKVLTHARRGGNPCPPLEENKWCGSSRDCSHAYFDW